MKKWVWLVAVMAAGATSAAPAERFRDWAMQNGGTVVVGRLAFQGITNAADQAAAMAGWEEEVVIAAALWAKAYRVI